MSNVVQHPGNPPTDRPAQPHNIELEQSLLGALLIHNDILPSIVALEPDHFYDPVHARIFDMARKRINLGLLASPVTMKGIFSADEGLAKLGGVEYLARLAGSVVDVGSVKHYVGEIMDLHARRVVAETVDTMQNQLCYGNGAEFSTVDQIIDSAEGTLARLRSEVSTAPILTSFERVLDTAAERANIAYGRGGQVELSTGLHKLDKIIGGAQRGCMIMVGARTSMGKTAFALEVAGSVLSQGKAVHIVSLEMTPDQIGQRLVSRALSMEGHRLEYSAISNGRMTEDQFRQYLEFSRAYSQQPLTVADASAGEIGRARASIQAAQKRWADTETPLGVVLVDYLQLLRVPGQRSKAEEVTEAARICQRLAKDFELPVIVLAQVGRQVDDRKDRRPHLSDIRWAAEAEDAADQVIFLYRHAYYLAQDVKGMDEGAEKSQLIAELEAMKFGAELIVAKNRHGPTSTAQVFCELSVNRFMDAPPMKADVAQSEMHEFR